jgi:hypothetical protein
VAKVYNKGQYEGDHAYGGGFGSASMESSRYLGWFVTFLNWCLVGWPIDHG